MKMLITNALASVCFLFGATVYAGADHAVTFNNMSGETVRVSSAGKICSKFEDQSFDVPAYQTKKIIVEANNGVSWVPFTCDDSRFIQGFNVERLKSNRSYHVEIKGTSRDFGGSIKHKEQCLPKDYQGIGIDRENPSEDGINISCTMTDNSILKDAFFHTIVIGNLGVADLPKQPEPLSLGDWVKNADKSCSLRYDIDWMKSDLNKNGRPLVIDLMDENHSIPSDGVYMYVFREDGKLYIRPNDRGTKGINGAVGSKEYLSKFNLNSLDVSCPWMPDSLLEPMYVRHSQLANGRAVISAGMLQYSNGKLIWVSNESGHYSPSIDRVEYMLAFLKTKNEPGADNAAICEKNLGDHGKFSGRGTLNAPECPSELYKLPR